MPGDEIGMEYWQALLRFATSAGASDAVNQPSDATRPTALSTQDRQFLENALSEYARATDPVVQLKNVVTKLLKSDFGVSPSESQQDETLMLVAELEDLCDQLDVANDFHKVGGYRILVPMLSSPVPEYRAAAANLVAVLSQNNPYGQLELRRTGMIEVLMEMVSSDPDPTASARVKALYALSCLVRENEENADEFVKNGGFEKLLGSLRSDSVKLKTKAAFLLSGLLADDKYKDEAISMELGHQLVQMWMDTGEDDHTLNELLAKCLVNLCTDAPQVINDIFESSSCVEEFCRNRIKHLEKCGDQLNDELELAKSLLNLFSTGTPSE